MRKAPEPDRGPGAAERPWAESYGGDDSPADLSTEEAIAASRIEGRLKQLGIRCPFISRLSIAARSHAALLSPEQETAVLDPAPLLALTRREGSVDYLMAPASVAFSPASQKEVEAASDILAEHAAGIVHVPPPHRCGIGFARNGERGVLTFLKVFHPLSLDPFPSRPDAGSAFVFSGRVDAEVEKTEVLLGKPDGTTARLSTPSAKGRFSMTVSLDRGPGIYELEVITYLKREPVIAVIAPLYVSVPAPKGEVERATPETETGPMDPERAAAVLFGLINDSRADIGLAPLKRNRSLDSLAQGHSADMAANGFVGHISPTNGDLEARLLRQGLRPSLALENVARGRQISRIHGNLMTSPAHRANILDPGVREIGIGLVSAEGDVFVTEVFVAW